MNFVPDQLTDDEFLGGQLRLFQPAQGYRAAIDSVLLAAACPARPGETVLDLGCGAGAASLCLAARVPGISLAGIELQPDYAALGRLNAGRNGVEIDLHEGSLTDMPRALRREFHHVIANPPYYPAKGSGSPLEDRATAMRVELPLPLWVETAARRLLPDGWLTMIAAVDALPELVSSLAPRLGSAAILPLAAREGRPARRMILRARKGGRSPFRLLAPLILHKGARHEEDRENYTPEVQAILRGGQSLAARFD